MEVTYFLMLSYILVICLSLAQTAQSNEVSNKKEITLFKALNTTSLLRYERSTKNKNKRNNRKVKAGRSRNKKLKRKLKNKQTQGRKKYKTLVQRKQKSQQQRQTARRRQLPVGAAREARGPLLGDICQFVDFTASRSQGSGCQDGAKIVIKGRTKSVRKQFLISSGRTIYGFIAKSGGKFAECGCATDISPASQCKAVSGLSTVSLKDSEVQARTQQQRAPLKGSSCQWLDLDRVRLEGQGCQDGAKFVLNKDQGVRKQLLYVEGRSVVAFIQNGLKFADCQLYTDVTANVQCKAVAGVESVSLSSSCTTAAAPVVTEGGGGLLKSHPKCGQTPGGKAECYFDCLVHSSTITSGQVVSNLECLDDCFLSEESRCVASLLKDVIRSGTCEQEYNPGTWGLNSTCQFSTPDYQTTFSPSITSGTCSSLTEKLLQEPACKRVIQQQQGLIQNTLQIILMHSCVNNPFRVVFEPPSPGEGPPGFRSRVKRGASWFVTEDRATSVASSELGGYKTLLEYENTRGRYPWICSLRLADSGQHLCGVTLLSTPPQDTVVVTSAHCSLHCSSSSGVRQPSCCCNPPGQQQCSQEVECGRGCQVRSIPATDLEVLCGGWQLGEEEKDEVLLPVTEVIMHSNYSIELGPGQGSDIAVIKVEDEELAKQIRAGTEIYPACLPLEEQPNSGVHAGWSNPPTRQFLEKYGTGFLKYYDDFSKQWHYKMDVQTACRDPTSSQIFGQTIKEPSDSWYPPGSLCAKDFSRQSCFNPGDSGSPLMARSNASQKLHAQGILSFSKGCDIFTMGASNNERTEWQLTQHSENPAVYVELSCFLPWVARQFGLAYEGPTACSKEQGMMETKQPCTETISNLFASQRDCIFPFFFEGQEYRECIQFSQDGFTLPVFQCPVRNITTKINGVSSFSFIENTHGYCLNIWGELDPEAECFSFQRVPPFSQCKNNCPGVQAFGLATTN